jgi:hypothetical protein
MSKTLHCTSFLLSCPKDSFGDTKEMTKEKVKTDEKYGLGEIIQTHANACDNFRPPAVRLVLLPYFS